MITVYKTTDIRIKRKGTHLKAMSSTRKGKDYSGFHTDEGDIPVSVIRGDGLSPMEVINTRGYGYAHRNDNRYRKTKNFNQF